MTSQTDSARPTSIVAGSNGVSVAVRLALDHPSRVDRLVLCWPATCGDPVVDGSVPSCAAHLLGGGTLRGVSDEELSELDVLVAVVASDPPNRIHAGSTVDQLVVRVPNATRVPLRCPEAPRPDFRAVRDAFVTMLVAELR